MTNSANVPHAATDSRLRRLIDDTLVDRSERPLDDLLRELVAAAASILDCRHAAISVLGYGECVEHFIAFGVDAELADRIGRLPSHRGMLGVVVDSGETVRVADIRQDERRVGLPMGHPPVRAMLGVPVMLDGRPVGGLYLSQPIGRPAFDEMDERSAVSIAAAAANLVEMVRTAADNARRDRWLTGAAEVSRDLVSGRHETPLAFVTERLLGIADADLVSVIAPGPSDDAVVVTAAAGTNANLWDGQLLSSNRSIAAKVMRTGEARAIAHLPDALLPDGMRAQLEVDATMLVPMFGTTDKRAVLTISRAPGRPAFTSAELGMATMFAGRIALALELAEVQAHRDQFVLVEERDRIARDLHDHVIQRLFAIGLTVQSAATRASGRSEQQLRDTVDDLDDTIKQIRSTIYGLTVPIVAPSGSIRAHAAQIIADLERALGFTPELEVHGPVDFGIDEEVLDDCVAVLREALTNVARHAEATRASVSIRVDESGIALTVRDNGRGIGEGSRRSGLANLRTRAERRGGVLVVESSGSHGTQLTWRVPIAEAARRD